MIRDSKITPSHHLYHSIIPSKRDLHDDLHRPIRFRFRRSLFFNLSAHMKKKEEEKERSVKDRRKKKD